MKANCLNCNQEFSYGYSKKGKFCSNKCQGEYRQSDWFEKNKPLFEDGLLKSRSAYKRFVMIRDGNKCSICGLGDTWKEKPLTMIIDHIDGDSTNNHPSNFRLVCPNCDSQLDTYKSRNFGKGRGSKGKKWFDRL